MLSGAFVRFLRLVANTFFRRIEVVGVENIPTSGAVILAGNHPNALVDGLLLMSQVSRPIRFLGNAKLWRIPLLGRLLDALGAVPVYPREAGGPPSDNRDAFQRVHEVLSAGGCIAIFPEGISHTGSELVPLKTGAARMALGAVASGGGEVPMVPFGLTYINRHRFRSQVLVHFGAPIVIDRHRLPEYREDERRAVQQLTDELRDRLLQVTLNAPDWETLRFIHAARRLYKPSSAELTPGAYVELSRRFLEHYTSVAELPDVQRLRAEVEDYQARLERLGLRDHQLSRLVSPGTAVRRIVWRTALMLLLLPFAVPGAIILVPIGWVAARIGNWFSYDFDDIATLKVVTASLLLLAVYLALVLGVGSRIGWGWGAVTAILIPASFFPAMFLLERQAQLLASIRRMLRLTRLGSEVRALERRRQELVKSVRQAADEYSNPALRRMFDASDFST